MIGHVRNVRAKQHFISEILTTWPTIPRYFGELNKSLNDPTHETKAKDKPRTLFLRKITGEKETLQQPVQPVLFQQQKIPQGIPTTEAAHSFPQMVFFSEACSWTYDSSIQGAAANELGRLRRWNNSRDPRGGGHHPGATEKNDQEGFERDLDFFWVSKHGWGLLVMAFGSQFVSNEFKNVNAWRKRLKSLASGCWQQRESFAV